MIANVLSQKIRLINELLTTCEMSGVDPKPFMDMCPVAIDVDHYTKLGPDQFRYQRYTYQHGIKLLVTITTNAHRVNVRELIQQEVLSVLVDVSGVPYNPMLKSCMSSEDIDNYHMTLDALDHLTNHLKGAFDK